MDTHYGHVIWTDHAIQRLYQRRITQSDAWYALKHPDGHKRGKSKGSTCYYKDYKHQRIEVVAKLNNRREWLVLSCWSKEVGTGHSVFPERKNFWLGLLKKALVKIWSSRKKKN